MGQTSYSINTPPVSYPGQIADNGSKDITTGLAVLAALIYGTLAVIDSGNDGGFDAIAAKAPSASADITGVGKAIGFVVADQARAQDPSVATPQYPQYSAVPLMRKGRIWLLAETAMADGANPFIRFAAGGGGTILGSVRNDADTASAVQPAAGQMKVVGTTAGPGYCVVEVDLV